MSVRAVAAWALATTCAVLAPRPGAAVPLFAQRYALRCTACHSVMPELNAFGNAFRDRGYRLDGVPRRASSIVALREQIGYERDPVDARRVVPAGAVLGALEVGRLEAFVHETLGSGGGPSSLFLAYAAYGDRRSGVLYRAGLIELPLVHSPAQRNDTLVSYGYEAAHVGLNDLSLTTTRWGIEAEKTAGATRLAATLSVANGGGSAYGGKPVATGSSGSFALPELGAFARFPLGGGMRAGIDALAGSRAIASAQRSAFEDPYLRGGMWWEAARGRLSVLAEQFYGRDANADGAGHAIVSRGGYARLRWALGAHAFAGLREDASATPAQTRALLWYAEVMPTAHARLLLEQQRALPGGSTTLQGALTLGFP